MDDLGERIYELHFNECWDETMFLSEREIEEWLDEIYHVIKSVGYTPQYKMQKIIDGITNFE